MRVDLSCTGGHCRARRVPFPVTCLNCYSILTVYDRLDRVDRIGPGRSCSVFRSYDQVGRVDIIGPGGPCISLVMLVL